MVACLAGKVRISSLPVKLLARSLFHSSLRSDAAGRSCPARSSKGDSGTLWHRLSPGAHRLLPVGSRSGMCPTTGRTKRTPRAPLQQRPSLQKTAAHSPRPARPPAVRTVRVPNPNPIPKGPLLEAQTRPGMCADCWQSGALLCRNLAWMQYAYSSVSFFQIKFPM